MYQNPYIAGIPISRPEFFFGRKDILDKVMQSLRHRRGNAIVLYGQRRIGKTSILLQLQKRVEEATDFVPVFFDLQKQANKPLVDLLHELAQVIALTTGQPIPEREQFDADDNYFHSFYLPHVARTATRSGLVLLFDEFDVLDNTEQSQAGQSFFPYLSRWLADIEQVRFVFVIGRRPEDLSIATRSTLKVVTPIMVSSFLDRETASQVILQSQREGSLAWSDDALDCVLHWTSGHPYFTQMLLGM